MIHKKFLILFSAFVWSTSIFASQQNIVRDSLGFSHIISSPPQRIISLAPNITEILFVLGLENRIVGVTRFCDFPVQAQKKEKVGGLVDPNIEKIIALNPDLIIGFRGNSLKILQRLRSLNLPLFVLEIEKSIESIFSIVNKIGKITTKEKEAQILIQALRDKYDKIQFVLQNVQHEPKIFLWLHGPELWTCGKDTFLDTLVREAKGVNIAGNTSRKWLPFNREQLIHKDPEIIIILSKSKQEFIRAKEWLKNAPPFRRIKAVMTDKIHFLGENLGTRPGPRFIDALAEMARLLHAELFERAEWL